MFFVFVPFLKQPGRKGHWVKRRRREGEGSGIVERMGGLNPGLLCRIMENTNVRRALLLLLFIVFI